LTSCKKKSQLFLILSGKFKFNWALTKTKLKLSRNGRKRWMILRVRRANMLQALSKKESSRMMPAEEKWKQLGLRKINKKELNRICHLMELKASILALILIPASIRKIMRSFWKRSRISHSFRICSTITFPNAASSKLNLLTSTVKISLLLTERVILLFTSKTKLNHPRMYL